MECGAISVSKLGKEYDKAVYCHPAYLTYMHSISGRLGESQAGINCWEKYQQLQHANDSTLMAESGEKLKSLLMRKKEVSGKAGLKLNIQKNKIMASWSHHFMAN